MQGRGSLKKLTCVCVSKSNKPHCDAPPVRRGCLDDELNERLCVRPVGLFGVDMLLGRLPPFSEKRHEGRKKDNKTK